MKKTHKTITYANSGVNIKKADKLIHDFKKTNSFNDSNIIEGIGGFSSLYKLNLQKFKNPIIVSSTDGVGTKLKLAKMLNQHKYIGQDLVAMCANDVITSGATPLFFLDYLATSKLDLKLHRTVLNGIRNACKKISTPLIGGETAEMPNMYNKGEYDLAGFCVGVVDKKNIIEKKRIKANDVLIGLSSSGFHSNGFSIINKLIKNRSIVLGKKFGGTTLGRELIKPTKLYVSAVQKIMNKADLHGAAHITGGGITENLPRVIPNEFKATVLLDSWKIPKIFSYIQEKANLKKDEMLKTFNCGIGMIFIVKKNQVNKIIQLLKNENYQPKIIGFISKSKNRRRISYE